MADPYQDCLCGCGRKLKQCAPRNVIQELDKIQQAIEGNQRISAVEQIDRLLEAEGGGSLLLAIKGRIQLELGELEAAVETISRFAALVPDSPTLKAQQAMVAAQSEGRSDAALQLVLEAVESDRPADGACVGMSLVTVAQALMAEDNNAAARQLLTSIGADSDVLRQLQMEAVTRERQDHFLVRMARSVQPAAEDHPLHLQLNAIDQMLGELRWLTAARKLEELREQHPDDDAVLRRIGVLLMLRERFEEADGVWREIASLESLDEDARLFAEAVAAATAPLDEDWYLDMLQVTFPIDNLDLVHEQILSDSRFHSLPAPPATEDGQPPPRGVYQLLDKTLPTADAEDLSLEKIPQMLGVALLYGKQTDAPARLEVESHEDNFPLCQELLKTVFPELAESKRETVGKLYQPTSKLSLQLVLPEGISPEQHQQVQRQAQQHSLLKLWPRTPHPALDGLTPAVAVRDKSRRRTVSALVLLQETNKGAPEEFSLEDCVSLREQLGLPHETVAASDVATEGPLNFDELTRLPFGELSDEQLSNCIIRLGVISPRLMVAPLEESLGRQDLLLSQELQIDRLCFEISQQARSPFVAVQWMVRAADVADARNESAAEYLLSLLMPAVMTGQNELVQTTLERLSTKHINQPGVREALVQFFHSIGIDPSTGAPLRQPAEAAATAQGQSEGLWTPDGETGGGGGKEEGGGKLWLPD